MNANKLSSAKPIWTAVFVSAFISALNVTGAALPSGYVELEWIESSGTQWIDTGIQPTDTLVTELSMTPGKLVKSAVFGAAWSYTGYFVMFIDGSTIRFNSRGGCVDTKVFNVDAANFITCDATGLTINEQHYALGGSSKNDAKNIHIFDCNAGGTLGSFKLHSFKMTDQEVVLRDYVPVRQTATGRLGLYDLAHVEDGDSAFYGNRAATGNDFSAGPVALGLVIEPIPDQEFTGEEIVPELSVKLSDHGTETSLVCGEDYDIVVGNALYLGVATVTVIGKGRCAGLEQDSSFNIVPPTDGRVSLAGNFERRILPVGVSLTAKGIVLVDDSGNPLDKSLYELSVGNCSETGCATVWAKVASGSLAGAVAAAPLEVAFVPIEFSARDGLQSTGAQRINSKVVPGTTTSLKMAFKLGGYVDRKAFFGGAWNGSQYLCTMIDNKICFHGSASGDKIVAWDASMANSEAVLEIASGETPNVFLTVGGVTASTTSSLSYNNGQTPMAIFDSTAGGRCSSYTLRSLQVWQDGVLIRDFIPVCRISDNKPGLLDLAHIDDGEDAFYVNELSGDDFVAEAPRVEFQIDAIEEQVFNGVDACCPVPVVRDRSTGEIVSPSLFSFSYVHNADVGIATVTVTGRDGTEYASQSTTADFTIRPVYYVTAVGTDGGDGSSWDRATTLGQALIAVAASGGEVWAKAGTMALEEGLPTVQFSQPTAIRGGFGGTERHWSERVSGMRTTIDGQGTGIEEFRFSNLKPIAFDAVAFFRFGGRGFYCQTTAADADVLLTNCAVRCCGGMSNWGSSYNIPMGSVGGGGAAFVGVAGSAVRLVDCDLSGQSSSSTTGLGSGGGAYFRDYGHASLERCTVVTNRCASQTWMSSAQAVALQFCNVPVSATECAFVGNCAIRGSMVVQLSGNCSNSVFRNCRFVGNSDDGENGILCASMATPEQTLLIENCTFAYNLVRKGASVCVRTGRAELRNSVFFANEKLSTSANGADISCGDQGVATVDYCLFGGKGADYVTGAVDIRATCLTDVDPLFVTTAGDFKALVNVSGIPIGEGAFPDDASTCALDVHLLSSEGFRMNSDLEWHQAAGVISPAVDSGDELSDFSREPSDNGGRINLGAYGNTPEASKTPQFELALDGMVTVEFPGQYSQPTVVFKLGGSGAYAAEAVVSVYVDDADVPAYVSGVIKGLSIGRVVTVRIPAYFEPGSKLVAKVELNAGRKQASGASDETETTGVRPPWDGKGGGIHVVHVRSGATGTGDGSSWTDAVEDLPAAFKVLTADKSEIWICGTNVLRASSPDFHISAPLSIRGGFDATECAVSDRKAGVRSRVDGVDLYDCLTFHNDVGAALTLEGIDFVRGGRRGVRKEASGGDLLVTNCSVVSCGSINRSWFSTQEDSSDGGSGISVVGDGAPTVRIVDCDIRENRMGDSLVDGCLGVGVMAHGLRRLIVDSCNVVSNCNTAWRGGGGQGVYCYRTPAEISNTRFLANDARGGGAGVLWLNASCPGSVIRNCAFVGNASGGNIGAVRVSMSEQGQSVGFENCTFAYNFSERITNTLMHVSKGDVSVRNCIFFGNLSKTTSGVGADLHVGTEGRVAVSYTLFGGNSEEYVTAVDSNSLVMSRCLFGDPLFVTGVNDFAVGAEVRGELPKVDWTTPSVDVRMSYNIHLRGGSGYVDEHEGRVDARFAKSKWKSPALDSGDPADKCNREPVPNGRRINLGYYGNTPYATRSTQGSMIFVR